ncbi:MAG: hypothetical protein ACUVWS_13855 [Roseiflexus sp.]
MKKGGVLAFGLAPTMRDLSGIGSTDLLTNWIIAAAACGRHSDMVSHTLVTATCGLGLLSEDAARRSFRPAHDVAILIGGM